MSNNKKKNTPKKGGKKGPKAPLGKSLWQNILVTLLIFFLIIGAYSLVVENGAKEEKIAISQLALQIKEGSVSEITVRGEELEILYEDGIEQKSKK